MCSHTDVTVDVLVLLRAAFTGMYGSSGLLQNVSSFIDVSLHL